MLLTFRRKQKDYSFFQNLLGCRFDAEGKSDPKNRVRRSVKVGDLWCVSEFISVSNLFILLNFLLLVFPSLAQGFMMLQGGEGSPEAVEYASGFTERFLLEMVYEKQSCCRY